MFNIITTQPGDANFELFTGFVKQIYPADSPVFKMPEGFNSEYLQTCYLLLNQDKVVARAALYNNPHLQYNNQKAYCIGNYEAIDDTDAATQLISHIAADAKQAGAQYLIGPMNGSTWDAYRFSTHHDHVNFFLEHYHHLYYNQQFINAGFAQIASYYSSLETDLQFNSPAVQNRQHELEQLGVVFRNIDLDNYDEELEKVFAFNATAFKTNFLYTPVSRDDFMKKYAQTKRFIDPEYVVFAEDADANLIGYFFCINDFYNTSSTSLIAKTAARHPDKKWTGIGHVMGNIICARAFNNGYKAIIHSFMYEDGTSKAMSKNFAGHSYKNYALYGMPL